MAVFTPVTYLDLTTALRDYALGERLDFCGITSGIENSNFFLTTTKGEYVLTIFEKLSETELPFYLNLMQHLAAQGLPVPDPVPRNDGTLFGQLHGKPMSIVTKLDGRAQLAPQAMHCELVGAMLARVHLAAQDLPLQQPNLRSLSWWQEVSPVLVPHLPPAEAALLESELAYQTAFFNSPDYGQLPSGPCHCDLFRDNALIVGSPGAPDRLGGFFDFYFAGTDKWLFDLAVTVNDWCVDLDSCELDEERTRAMLSAYQSVRPLGAAEKRHWRDMLRAAALRFWLSRLFDFHMPRAAEMLQPHDPGRFERTLRARIRTSSLYLDQP